MFPGDELSCGAQVVADAGIGTGTDEDSIDGNVHDGRAGLEAHIFERALGSLLIV